jgi:copper(I)-binding protein
MRAFRNDRSSKGFIPMTRRSLFTAALLAATALPLPAIACELHRTEAKMTLAADHSGGHGAHHDKTQARETPATAPIDIGDLAISDAWVRATLPNQTVGGGYLTIENTGGEDDRLIAVSAPISERAEIHEMSMDNDIMTMRPVNDGIVIEAGGTVDLAPGGLHLMFPDLEDPIEEGDAIPVTLTFERAGEVTIEMPVLPASAGRGAAHQH